MQIRGATGSAGEFRLSQGPLKSVGLAVVQIVSASFLMRGNHQLIDPAEPWGNSVIASLRPLSKADSVGNHRPITQT
jgi:hypothetical protein